MLERQFQSKLIKELKDKFLGCIVLKNDASNTPQGFPDLTILYNGKTAFLECKKSEKEKKQPNQQYYVDHLKEAGYYASFIYPENKEEKVCNDLERTFRS